MPQEIASNATTSKQQLASAAVLGSLAREKTFVNLLTEDIGKSMGTTDRHQSNVSAPIVNITDLKKNHGTTYSFDILGKPSGLPTMGNDSIDGNEEEITSSSYKLKIDASRLPLRTGGYMTRQSYGWSLNEAGRAKVVEYFARLAEQRAVVHLAGARGSFNNSDIIIPFESHAKFAKTMINPVSPPTHNRHFYGGGKVDLTTLTASDTFGHLSLVNIRRQMDESAEPLMGVSMRGSMSMDKSMYVMFVTPKQWADYKTNSDTKDFENQQANALARTKNWQGNSLFVGDMFMFENILVMKNNFPIRFASGESVRVSANDKAGTVSNVACARDTDRAIILGGQALATAWGNADPAAGADTVIASPGKGLHLFQDTQNGGANGRITATVVNGCGKITMFNDDGFKTDRGVAVLDTAVTS